MYIKHLRLKNFKKHKEFAGTFYPGTNAICGPNGAGKTSLVEAIGFALFNHRKYRKLSELIRKGCKKATIIVEFEAAVDEREYLVQREITQRGGGRYVVHDKETGNLLAQKTEECQQVIQDLMQLEPGIDLPRLFETTLGVPQGTLTSAFLLTPKERKKTFYPLLRVEDYQQAFDNMRGFVGSIEGRRQELALHLGNRLELLQQLPQKQAVCKELGAELGGLEKELGVLREEEPKLRGQLEEQQELRRALEECARKLGLAQQQLQRLTSDEAAAKRAYEEAKEAEQTVVRVSQAAKQYEEAKAQEKAQRKREKEAQALHKELARQQLQVDRLQQQRESLQKECETLEEMVQEQARVQPLVEEQGELEKQLEEQRKKQLQHQQVQKTLGRLEKEAAKLEEEKAGRLKKVEALREMQPAIAELGQLEHDGKVRKEELEQAQRNQERREQAHKELDVFTKEYEAFVRVLEEDEKRYAQLVALHEPVASTLEQHEQKRLGLQKTIATLEAQIERERDFRKDVSGGVCPFFQAPCLNVPEGQNLSQYITHTLQQAQDAVQTHVNQQKFHEELFKKARHARHELDTTAKQLQVQIEEKRRQRGHQERQREQLQKALDALPDRREELGRLQEEVKVLRQRYRDLREPAKEAQRLPVEEESLQRILDALRDKEAQRKQEQAQLEKLVTEPEELTRSEKRLQELDNPRERLRFLKKKCEALPRLHKELAACKTELGKLQKALGESQQKQAAYEDVEEKLQALHEQLQETEEAHHTYLQYKKSAQKLPQAHKDHEAAQQALVEGQDACKRCEEAHAPLQAKFDPERGKEISQRYEEHKHRRAQLEALVPVKQSRLKELQEELEKLLAFQEETREQEQELGRLRELVDCSQLLRETYQEAGPRVTRALIGSISQEANRIFRHLMNQSRLHLQWNETFDLLIEEDGEERSFANLSGGEQMSAALAVRLALVRELSSVRIAFFDEPTAHMDEERRQNLVHQLIDIKGFHQLFVISHDDTFESITDHVIWIGPQGAA